MSGYQRSAAREREIVNTLRDQGKVAYRTPASKGAADVIVLDDPNQLIQVKTGGSNPYSHFGPTDRQRLLDEAARANGRAVLFWWPGDGSGLTVIPPEEWP